LKWGGVDYAWSSGQVIGCMVGFVVLLAILIFTQIRQGDRYVDTKVKRSSILY
jgi:hypothetical protein